MSQSPSQTCSAVIDTDECLVALALNGSAEAFGHLVERYFGLVYSVVFSRLWDREAAEDLTQEVFMRAFVHLGNLKTPAVFGGWVARIGRNLAANWIRDGQTRSGLMQMAQMDSTHKELPDLRQTSPREQVFQTEERNALREALARLPDEIRDIVLLHYAEGLSKAEIARQMGTHQSTVGRQLDRALGQLKRFLASHVQESLRKLGSEKKAAIRTSLAIGCLAAMSAAQRAAFAAASVDTAMLGGSALGGEAATSSTGAINKLLARAGVSGNAAVTAKTLLVIGVVVACAAIATQAWHRQTLAPKHSYKNTARPAARSSMYVQDPRSRPQSNKLVPSMNQNSSEPPRLELSGHVILRGGAPATSAVIELLTHSLTPTLIARGCADIDGVFKLECEDQPELLMRASRPGAATLTSVIMDEVAIRTRNRKQSGTRRVVRYVELQPSAPITGRVETDSGQPASGISVAAVNEPWVISYHDPMVGSDRLTTTSRSDGSFTLDNLPAGVITLVVDDPVYLPLRRIVTAPEDNVVLRLAREGGSIEGAVRLQSTKQPAAGAKVVLSPSESRGHRLPPQAREAVSGPDGSFRFSPLSAGEYRLSATRDGLFSLPSEDPRGTYLYVKDSGQTTGVVVTLYPGHTIQGKVTDKDTSAPISGVQVQLCRATSQGDERVDRFCGNTDADGFYRITGVGGLGRHIPVLAEKRGHMVVSTKPDAPAELFADLSTDQLECIRNIQMTPLVRISGTVVTPSGTEVPGATVSLRQASGSAITEFQAQSNSSGAFEIDAPPLSKVVLTAEANGYSKENTGLVYVPSHSLSDVKIIVRYAGSLRGIVVDPSANPVEGATVSAGLGHSFGSRLTEHNSREVQSGTRGVFLIEQLAPEENFVYAYKDGFSGSRAEWVRVTPGDTQNSVTLQLRPAHAITGKVVNEAQQPIEGAGVSLDPAHIGAGSGATTDATGAFRLYDLGDQHYKMSISAPGYENATKEKVAADTRDLVIALRAERNTPADTRTGGTEVVLAGTVMDKATEQPIPEFTVAGLRHGIEIERDGPGTFTARGFARTRGYHFQIQAPGYAALDSSGTFEPAGQTSYQKTFEMERGASLSGRLVEKRTKQPLAGARVSNLEAPVARGPFDQVVVTGSDGKFRLEGLPSGKIGIEIQPAYTLSANRSFTVRAGQENDVGDVVIQTSGEIRGRVVYGAAESPVAGTMVFLIDRAENEKKTQTDSDGGFRFTGLENASNYGLSVPEFILSYDVDLSSQDEAEVLLQAGGATFRGKVTLGARTPDQCNIRVTKDNYHRWSPLGAYGQFEMSNLAAGKWQYRLDYMVDKKWQHVTGEVDLSEGMTVKDFDLSTR